MKKTFLGILFVGLLASSACKVEAKVCSCLPISNATAVVGAAGVGYFGGRMAYALSFKLIKNKLTKNYFKSVKSHFKFVKNHFESAKEYGFLDTMEIKEQIKAQAKELFNQRDNRSRGPGILRERQGREIRGGREHHP